MLRSPLLHPGILSAAAAAGHGSLVLIADANYPASTAVGPHAQVVHLNLTPGIVDAVTVLAVLSAALPIEAAHVMSPEVDGPHAGWPDPEIWSRFAAALAASGFSGPLQRSPRFDFYAAAATPAVALVVVTAETALYGNVLLRIGVVELPGTVPTPSGHQAPAARGGIDGSDRRGDPADQGDDPRRSAEAG